EGAPVTPFAAGIPKTAAHPNAAKLFMNWCLSEEGQAFMIKGIGNLTSLKKAPLYPEGFDPKVVKVWVPNYDQFVKLQRGWLDDVSFSIAAGEIVVLLGPSGCGKTTTLRCIAGLEHPTSGAISIGPDLVSAPERGVNVPSRLRNIGMVFQSYAVWPHMTVKQNVAYPLRHRKVARADIERRVAEVLELVGLSEYASRPVTELSGGQMQRVALAR